MVFKATGIWGTFSQKPETRRWRETGDGGCRSTALSRGLAPAGERGCGPGQ
jgi:hypothetical protein